MTLRCGWEAVRDLGFVLWPLRMIILPLAVTGAALLALPQAQEILLIRNARLLQFTAAGVDWVPTRDLPWELPVAANKGGGAEPMAEWPDFREPNPRTRARGSQALTGPHEDARCQADALQSGQDRGEIIGLVGLD